MLTNKHTLSVLNLVGIVAEAISLLARWMVGGGRNKTRLIPSSTELKFELSLAKR